MAMPKRTLKMREATIRTHQFRKLEEVMEKTGFSFTAMMLSEEDNFGMSGKGEERGFICQFYYEPKTEGKTIAALAKLGINVKDYEAVNIDPDSPFEHHQTLMYMEGPTMIIDPMIHEVVDPNPPSKRHY